MALGPVNTTPKTTAEDICAPHVMGVSLATHTTDKSDYSRFNAIAAGNGVIVGVESSGKYLMYSEDGGKTWKTGTGTTMVAYFDVCFGGGMFVAICNGASTFAYSVNGKTWTEISNPGGASVTGAYRICYGNGRFVVGVNSAKVTIVSEDGKTWTRYTDGMSKSGYVRDMVCGKGKFVMLVGVAGATTIDYAAYSEDGHYWTFVQLPEAVRWDCIAYGNGLFMAVDVNSSAKYMTSLDGITWTVKALPFTDAKTSVNFCNGLFAVTPKELRANNSANQQIWLTIEGDSWVSVNAGAYVSLTSNACTADGIGMVWCAGEKKTMRVEVMDAAVTYFAERLKPGILEEIKKSLTPLLVNATVE